MNQAGLELTYFRHPYLDTGASDFIRKPFEQFLKEVGYIIAYWYRWLEVQSKVTKKSWVKRRNHL